MKNINIAIDGPSGAGKSTMAKKLAADLGFIYVDTGAMYRAVGLYVSKMGIDAKDKQGIISALPGIKIELKYENGEQKMYVNGKDVSGKIRTEVVAAYASAVSALPEVRDFLLETQRQMARGANVIMDGRDIGTVVLPDAQLKIFLIANLTERARRRYEEMIEKGTPAPYDEILKSIEKRDENDRNRKNSPLVAARDAVLLDTTGDSIEKTYDTMLKIVRERVTGVL